MAIVWVQQWWALPVILEEHQIDGLFAGSQSPSNMLSSSPAQVRHPQDDSTVGPASTSSTQTSHEQQVQGRVPQRRPMVQPTGAGGQRASPGNSVAGSPADALNMGPLLGALPESRLTAHHATSGYQSNVQSHQVPQNQQRSRGGHSPSSIFPLHQAPAFMGQTPMLGPGYNLSQYDTPAAVGSQAPNTLHPFPLPANRQQTILGGLSPNASIHPNYQNFGFIPNQVQQQQYLYYPSPQSQGAQTYQSFYGRPAPFPGFPSAAGRKVYEEGSFQQHHESASGASGRAFNLQHVPPYGTSLPNVHGPGGPYLEPDTVPFAKKGASDSSSEATSFVPRGPPRKPRQSGHALWVGNLPPGTAINDLKDHFSREAARDIESCFLISKSNCAFVNYRTEEACAAAMARFHDSRFHGVRLVCRLRRNPADPVPGAPTGPAALSSVFGSTQTPYEGIPRIHQDTSQGGERADPETAPTGDGPVKTGEKFYILKSLTVEDLELSVRTGIWATQAHNEVTLNEAFKVAENIYLIFSANKSGEYFGYAKMVSPINDDVAKDLHWAPQGSAEPADLELPRSIPTAATIFAPRGRIIDDSARGTIFWEAEDDDQTANQGDENIDREDLEKEVEARPISGKPFKIEWLSTIHVPFYRTRGLRNPWNAHREVKIARDGTELETNVGKRLIQMFHRPHPQASTIPMSYPNMQVH